MNEYLRKDVGDRRTGANITGINVNLENMNNLTNDFTHAFNEIENFARRSDELAIRNEKTKLMLDIEQKKVNFRQTYLDDPSTYASDEKFQEVGRLYKQEMVDAQKTILASKYLSQDEKMLLNKEIKLDFSKTWLDPAKKRNMAVSQDRINDVVMINDTLVNIYSNEDFNRTDVLPNYVKRATKSFNPLIEMGILTEGDVNKALVKGMSQIEGARLKQMTLDKIINNDTYTDSQKEQMLKEAMDSLSNDSRIKELATALTSEYGFDEEEKAYLESSLKSQYKESQNYLNGKMKQVKNANSNRSALYGQGKAQNTYDNKMVKAVAKNDLLEVIHINTGMEFTTQEVLDVNNSIYFEKYYGKERYEFANPYNTACAKVIRDSEFNEQIANKIATIKSQTGIEPSTREKAQIINEYVGANIRNIGDDIVLLKDIGNRKTLGIPTKVLLTGKDDPRAYDIHDVFISAKKFNEEEPIEIRGSWFFGTNPKKRFGDLLNTPIDSNGTTLNTTIGRDKLTKYIVGIIKRDEDLEKVSKVDMGRAIERVLKDDVMMAQIKEDLPLIYKLECSPINYEMQHLKPYQRGVEYGK